MRCIKWPGFYFLTALFFLLCACGGGGSVAGGLLPAPRLSPDGGGPSGCSQGK